MLLFKATVIYKMREGLAMEQQDRLKLSRILYFFKAAKAMIDEVSENYDIDTLIRELREKKAQPPPELLADEKINPAKSKYFQLN